MYQPLSPCPGCLRHIIVTEARCPFCAHALTAPLPIRPDATRRMSRAAVFSFAASLTVAGCGASVTATDASPGGDVPVDTGSADTGLADTGLADTGPTDTGPRDTGLTDDGRYDLGNVAPPYGVPADAGAPDDDGGAFDLYGSPPVDAGAPDDDGGIFEPYGTPPPDASR